MICVEYEQRGDDKDNNHGHCRSKCVPPSLDPRAAVECRLSIEVELGRSMQSRQFVIIFDHELFALNHRIMTLVLGSRISLQQQPLNSSQNYLIRAVGGRQLKHPSGWGGSRADQSRNRICDHF